MRVQHEMSDSVARLHDINRRRFLVRAAGLGFTCMVAPRLLRASTASFDYYISPTGSDANAGTLASPWSLSSLSTKPAIAGKRVGLLDGTYVVTGTGTGNGGYIQGIAYGGSTASPTVVQSVNPLGAVITTNNNGSYPQATATVFGVTADNVTISDIRFQQLACGAIQVAANNVRIQGCDIYDLDLNRYPSYASTYPGDNMGAVHTANEGSGLIISNCRISHVRNGNGSHNEACLGPFFHYTNIVIEYCTLLDATTGVYFKNDVSGLTVRYCYFGQTQLGIYGLMYYSTTHPKLANFAYNNIFNQINQIVDGADEDAAADVSFYNNTVIAGSNASYYGTLASFSNPQGASAIYQANFYNNIWCLTGSAAPVLLFQPSSAPPRNVLQLCDYNCYPSTHFSVVDRTATANSYSTLSGWRAATGKDMSSIQSDNAMFLNVTGTTPAAFRLAAGSPCINQGHVGGVANGAAIDLGAWGGATAIGHNFGAAPMAPVLAVS